MFSRVKAHLGLIFVLLLYLAVAVYTNLRVPLHLGSDEVAHFMFARFVRENGYLPLSPADRLAAGYKSDQPPLNAMVVALAYFWGDLGPPLIKLTENQPRRQLSVIADNYVGWQQALNTEDPWAGEILFWRVGRFVSTFFGAATLVVVYFMALIIFDGFAYPRRWAVAAVMSVAFIPTFVLVSSVFSYESLAGFWLALYLLTAIYIIKNPARNRLYFGAGLFIGLAIATKLSAIVAPLGLIGLTLATGFARRWPLSGYLKPLFFGVLGVTLGAGWWLALIVISLNRVAELGWLAGLLAPIIKGDGSDPTAAKAIGLLSGSGDGGPGLKLLGWQDLLDWLNLIFTTFWRYRDQGAGPETGSIYLALKWATGLILVGLVKIGWTQRRARPWLGLFLGQIALFTFLPLVRLVFTGPGGDGHNGHHILFPAAGAVAILSAWGLGSLFPRRVSWPYVGAMALGAALLGWSIVRAVQIYHPPLPVRTVPPLLPAEAQSQSINFGPVELVGYQLNGLSAPRQCCVPDSPALGVNLYWQALEYSQQDYLTEVKLVDRAGQVQSAWLGYPANGRYPTRAWDPGDVVRDEVWLPLAGLAAGPYTVTLQLRQSDDLQPVQAEVTLTQIELTNPPPPVNAVTVWQQGRPAAAALPEFASWRTIQITAPANNRASLSGPESVIQPALVNGGQTHLFIVDPRWPKHGEYSLRLEAEGQPATQTGPILRAAGLGRKTEAPPSQVPVEANFANQLKLLGYNLPQRRFQPGAEIPVMLQLQALKTMPADFLMFTRLRDAAGQVWGGHDRRPQGLYSTLLWSPDEVVEDGFTINIKPTAPPGVYYVDIGFYLPVGQAPVSLPLVQAGQMSDVTSVTLGPVKIGRNPPGLTQAAANPQVVLNQPFGDAPNLTLLGYTPEPASDSAQNLKLTLFWRSESPLPLDYTTFVHLRNAAGETVAQKDQPPLAGAYPTSLWDPGEIIADEITVPLAGVSPGEYTVVMGLYNLADGARLPIPTLPNNEISLGSRAFAP